MMNSMPAAPRGQGAIPGHYKCCRGSLVPRAWSRLAVAVLGLLVTCATAASSSFDLLIKGGRLYDGSGQQPIIADVAVRGDRIVEIGQLDGAKAVRVIDAGGMAVAPGFINMLSWGADALLVDGRGVSDVTQGVTLEVFGEGWSMGPLSPAMKKASKARQTTLKYDIAWDTLGEFLDHLVAQGVSPNVASFVGAATIRAKQLGFSDRAPDERELAAMQADVAVAMQEGAMGLGSALIYPPGSFASREELVALAEVVASFGGSYITHMRSEGDRLLEAVDEVLAIHAATGAPVEIYHLKAAGQQNWSKMDAVIERINGARESGVPVRANMYTYTAGSTGLSAAMPPWVQEGGVELWMKRLRDPSLRDELIEAIENPGEDWENIYLASGGAENVLLVGFRNPELRHYAGKTLAEVAALRGQGPAATIIDLIVEDGSRVEAVYFMMSEENLEKQLRQDWVSFQSDAPALAPEGDFLKQSTHPRAYGTFARLLGRYVREKQVISLEEAIRRLTSLPASNLKIAGRGLLREGYFADIVVFDAGEIQDHATYTDPHQLSTGVRDVIVNGVQVVSNGEHTGALPGRVVRGPGYRPRGAPAQE